MNHDHRSDGAEETLLQRMQAADPARTLAPADSDTTDLLEAAMTTTPTEPKSRSRRWAPTIAAAAAVAVVGGTAYVALGGEDPAEERASTSPTSTAPSSTETTLAMPAGGDTSMNSCLPFDAQILRDMPVALSGTATEVGGDGVTIDVDRWYTGGDADVVRLAAEAENTVALDGVSFEQGGRYLITATEGTVTVCGYSGPWSSEMADVYAEAFGS